MGPRILGIRVGEMFHVISSASIVHFNIELILSLHQLELGSHGKGTHKNQNSVSCNQCIFQLLLRNSNPNLTSFQVDLCHSSTQIRME